MKSDTKKLDWIDGIKAFAIIAILLNHFVESFGPGPWFSNPSYNWPAFSVRMATIFPKDGSFFIRIIKFLGWLGDMGPGVFFLVSGLTLTVSALNKPLKTFDFYRKRLLRIYPLYIAIHIIVMIAAKYWFKWDIHFFSIPTILSLLGLRFTDSLFFYINPSWWFIWVIIQMYFLFPFLLILLKKKGIRTFLLVTFGVTILSRLCGILGFTYSKDLYSWITGIFAGTRLFEFSFGMYLGYLLFYNNLPFIKFLSKKRKVLFFSFCIYILGFIFSWTYFGSIFSNIFITVGLSGLFYSIFEIIFNKTKAIKTPLLWIGKNSFSVFLLHQPFMMFISSLLKGFQKGIALIIVVVLSFVVGYLIEKLVAFILKITKKNKVRINTFLGGNLNRTLILTAILLATIISFLIMICFSWLDYILKLLLFMIAFDIVLARINKKNSTFFVSRFFDIVLILSLIFCLITDNWRSVYWIVLVLSLIPIVIALKLKPSLSILFTILSLFSGIYVLENYLRKNHPSEIIEWGEKPALQMDSKTIFSLIPNKITHLKYNNYDYYVKTNSLGFNSPEINFSQKSENEKRVLVIGDAFSMPEGMEYNSSYSYLLEQKLRKEFPGFDINVINAGVTGYGPNEEYAQLVKYIGLIKPDIVINQFFVNEYFDITVTAFERRKNIGFFVDQSFVKKYFGNDQTPLYLDRLVQKKLGIINRAFYYDKCLLPLYEKHAMYYDDTVKTKMSKYFDKMDSLCVIHNAKYIVMYVPGQIEVSKPKDIVYYPYFENLKDTTVFSFSQPEEITKDLCSEKRITYLNTTGYLKAYRIQPVYFPESWHWNKEGHEAIAEYLYNYITTNNLLSNTN